MLRQTRLWFGRWASWACSTASPRQQPPDPLAPKTPHFAPRAKRVVFLFMHGGPSAIDTFDPKPRLDRDNGKPLPFERPHGIRGRQGNAEPDEVALEIQALRPERHRSQRSFPEHRFVHRRYLRYTLHGRRQRAHGGAMLQLHTGSHVFTRPSMGSWVLYGLGSENHDLPGFIGIGRR